MHHLPHVWTLEFRGGWLSRKNQYKYSHYPQILWLSDLPIRRSPLHSNDTAFSGYQDKGIIFTHKIMPFHLVYYFFFITKSTAFFFKCKGACAWENYIRKDTETLTHLQTNETHFIVIKTACICSFHKPLIKTSSSHEYGFITNSIEIYMTHIVILIQKAWLNRCFCCLAVSAGIKQKLHEHTAQE